jgi:hypothetical protein
VILPPDQVIVNNNDPTGNATATTVEAPSNAEKNIENKTTKAKSRRKLPKSKEPQNEFDINTLKKDALGGSDDEVGPSNDELMERIREYIKGNRSAADAKENSKIDERLKDQDILNVLKIKEIIRIEAEIKKLDSQIQELNKISELEAKKESINNCSVFGTCKSCTAEKGCGVSLFKHKIYL